MRDGLEWKTPFPLPFHFMEKVASFRALATDAWALLQKKFTLLLPIFILGGLANISSGYFKALDEQHAVVSGEAALVILVAGLAFILLSMLFYIYSLMVIMREKNTVPSMQEVLSRFFPLIGLGCQIFFRSYVWIIVLAVPFAFSQSTFSIAMLILIAAVVCSVVFMPRYMLAKFLWIQENKGVTAAVNKSYKATEGYWGKIVGNLILVGVVGLAATIIAGILIAIASGLIAGIAGAVTAQAFRSFGSGFVSSVCQMFAIIFGYFLMKTIIKHPRKS